VAVLALEGRLDTTSAPGFRQRLNQLVATGVNQVVVDLGEVGFANTSGLGAIIAGLKQLRTGGGDLRIARPNPQVRIVLERTSLYRVLPPYGTVEEALVGF
jgi:anti-sigma B factor antagonist